MGSMEDALKMLGTLSGNVDTEQTKLQELAAKPLRTAFANEGQSGFQALMNPDDRQRQAINQIALNMMGSDPTKGVGAQVSDSVSKGLSLMETMQEKKDKRSLGAQKLAVAGAQGAFYRSIDMVDALPEKEKPIANYTLGKTRYSGATNKPIASSAGQEADAERPVGNLSPGYQWKEGLVGVEAEPIPGGGKAKFSPEQAAKVQLIEGALSMADELDSFFYQKKEDGTLDYSKPDYVNIGNMNMPFGGTPYSEGRSANVLIKDSMEAKLRAESGAAVPDTEVARAAERFTPSLLDSPETIALKRKLLRTFLEGTQTLYDPTGRLNKDGKPTAKLNADGRKYFADLDALLDQQKKATPGTQQTKTLGGVDYYKDGEGRWHTQD